ncbi:MAG TPA: hypothetical protein VNZ64_00080 [Candidatus Acidoferrum sp.]|nr:hypothetical protein [Candidatus Acidoferrum sp.]
MTRKMWCLFALAALLGASSLYLNRDWFAGDNIHVYHRSRPFRSRRARPDNSRTEPIVFFIDRKLKLTSLKVVPVSDIETNKFPQPVWHLLSDSNSVPVKEFAYGAPLQGMRPAIKGTAPEPLEPGANYRLFVEAGSQKAQHDFVPVARAQ